MLKKIFLLLTVAVGLNAERMSVDEKIGELLCLNVPVQVSQRKLNEAKALIEQYHIGTVIIHRRGSYMRAARTINALKEENPSLMVMFDAEWGLSMRLPDALRFPHNMTLGAIQDESLIYELGLEIGRQLRLIGVHFNCAPVVDVNVNPKNPVINDRSFGELPENVIHKSRLFVQGLQEAGVIACSKHFSGHGDTEMDSHVGLPKIYHDLSRLQKVELRPFQQMVNEGGLAIMTSHMAVPALTTDEHCPITFSRNAIDYLRHRMGFDGLVATDGLKMGALEEYFKIKGKKVVPGMVELEALRAGHDLLVMAQDIPATVEQIKQALKDGRLSEEELDEHVARVQKIKKVAGVYGEYTPVDLEKLEEELFSPKARELKRKLYADAVTVATDTDQLPINREELEITYIQIGGEETGRLKKILEREIPEIEIEHLSCIPSGAETMETDIVVKDKEMIIVGIFGMNKFAQKGFGIAPETREFLEVLRKQKKNMCIVLFGSPYSLKYFDKYETVVVAYEDDPDAQEAAANIILGQQRAIGRLPVSATDKYRAQLSDDMIREREVMKEKEILEQQQ